MQRRKIKELRKNKGLCQKDIAKLMGVSKTTYSKKEGGLREFSESEWIQLSDILMVSVNELQNEENFTGVNCLMI